ncbi:unnamed protein product [Darwinula stevensoni]|uniref:Uncharacterized protein n=1 Tax=Darwinula stevensoni TaxID=69355 RepID=A0A7R9AED3_9CRUS|nr:unnamed protein product [Darwinula stevensoni]CAG0901339.1 unnamed protein product [Darwinula stevensoni]
MQVLGLLVCLVTLALVHGTFGGFGFGGFGPFGGGGYGADDGDFSEGRLTHPSWPSVFFFLIRPPSHPRRPSAFHSSVRMHAKIKKPFAFDTFSSSVPLCSLFVALSATLPDKTGHFSLSPSRINTPNRSGPPHSRSSAIGPEQQSWFLCGQCTSLHQCLFVCTHIFKMNYVLGLLVCLVTLALVHGTFLGGFRGFGPYAGYGYGGFYRPYGEYFGGYGPYGHEHHHHHHSHFGYFR